MRINLKVFLLLVFLATSVKAQSSSRIRDLRVDERVQDFMLLDLNGDNFLDLAALSADANGNVFFFWIAGTKKGLEDGERKSVNLGSGVIGLDLADYTGDGVPELIRWTDSGIDALTLPTTKVKSKTLKLFLPAESKLSKVKRWTTLGDCRFIKIFYDFGKPIGRGFLAPLVNDFDIWAIGKGMANHQVRLLIPERNQLVIYPNGDVPDSSYQVARPAGWVIDIDKDSDLDLLFFDQERILSFTNNDGFNANPNQVLIVSKAGRDLNPQWSRYQYFCVDINRDRLPDLIRSSTSVYGYGVESIREIFLCRDGGTFSTKPDLTHKVPRFESIQAVTDLTGDGYDDLVVSSIPGSAPDFIESINNNKLEFSVDVYEYQDNGISKKPMQMVRGMINLPFMVVPETRVLANGDFNGDGDNDLLVPFGDEYRIYWNMGKDRFTDKDHIRVPLVPSDQVIAADMTGDGKSEIVCSHQQGPWVSVIQIMLAGFDAAP